MKGFFGGRSLICALAGTLSTFGVAVAGSDSDAKIAEMKALGIVPAAATDPLTLTNGTGDGRLTIRVDGYGSFGSTTPAGDVTYDPAGSIGPSGAVWESAVYFSPRGNFLSTGSMHTGAQMPAIPLTRVDGRTATSRFTVSGFAVALRQEVLPASATGTTFVQTYTFTNNTSTGKTVQIDRYLEGDLYFVGSFGNDYAGVSVDGKTVYQFDTGDDPAAPNTFVGIRSTGGTYAGYSAQRYRFTDAIVSAKGVLPSAIKNKIYGDADNNRFSDSGFDAGIIQQNTAFIPAGGSFVYVTKTIFGSGSINAQLSKVSGCITLNGAPAGGRRVEAQQPGVTAQATTTDVDGCYRFEKLVAGKAADIVIKLPTINP